MTFELTVDGRSKEAAMEKLFRRAVKRFAEVVREKPVLLAFLNS